MRSMVESLSDANPLVGGFVYVVRPMKEVFPKGDYLLPLPTVP